MNNIEKVVVNARFLLTKITGVQRYAISLSRELKKQYPGIIFVCPMYKANVHYDEELFNELDVKQIGRFTGHLWEQISLPLYLNKIGKPLLLNFSGLSPLIYRESVHTIHDMSVFHQPKWFGLRYSVWYRIMLFLLSKRVRQFITCSEFSKKEIQKYLGIEEKNICVLYPECNFDSDMTAGRNTEEKKKIILAVSSIDPRKNFQVLFDAIEHLDLSKYTIQIVGGGGKAFSSHNLKVSDTISAEFLGYVNDEELCSLYKNADVFIYTSLYEGFGIPPIEAMSQGCPVISSNAASLPEACGNAALYFDPMNSVELAESIELLSNDKLLRKRLVDNGFLNVLRFDMCSEIEKLCKFLNMKNKI